MKKTLLSPTSESWMRSCYNTQILVRSFFSCCCWILPLISVYCARTYHLNIRFFKVLDFIHPPEFVFTQVTPKRSFLLSPRVPLSPPPARVRLRTREAGNIPYSPRRALRGALAAGRENEGELVAPRVAPRRLCCQISANRREAERSANVSKHWKARVNGNDVITNVISANQHVASTFSMQIFKFQRRSCKFSFLFPHRRQSTPKSLLAG